MSILGRVVALLRSEFWGGAFPHRRIFDIESGTGSVDTDSRSHSGSQSKWSRNVIMDPKLAGYYANLELPYGSDIDAVREARRRLLRRYHPDLHSTNPERRRTSTELTQGLNSAHDELVSWLERK